MSSVGLVGAVAALALLAGCTQGGNGQAATGSVPSFAIQAPPSANPQPPYATPTTAAEALADLGRLQVQASSSVPPYQAALFVMAKTAAGSSCDPRNTVLKRDLTQVTFGKDSTCKVASGVIFDPYTAQWRWFSSNAVLDQVDVDHVVAFSDAWANGAYNWPRKVLTAFASDPIELHATAATVLPLKGEKNAAAWLPPATAYRCRYVIDQITVKVKYSLSVSSAERDAMTTVLNSCPANIAQPAPTTSPPPAPTLPPKPKHAKPKP